MVEARVQDVSDTALMVATYRARETERSNALFRDPLALKRAGKQGEAIVANLPRGAGFGEWMVADCLSPESRRYRKRMEKKMQMENAPFKFDPADSFAFFQAHG